MELFLLELWRDDCLSAVRAYVPAQTEDLINDDGIPQFVMQFSYAIKELVDWESERLIYRDSDDENIFVDGVSGDGILESVLDALGHWPFIYKVQYSIVPRPPVHRVRAAIVDEFPDVSFTEIPRFEPSLRVVKKEEEERREILPIQRILSNDTFHDFLVELEKHQEEIQQSLRRESFCASTAMPIDVMESIANESTKQQRRLVPGTPLEDHARVTDELSELAERVERQLSLLNENTTVTTQTEAEEWQLAKEETSNEERGVTKYKAPRVIEQKKQKKNPLDNPKVVILKVGKTSKDLHRSEEMEDAVYSQSVRVMNLSRNPVQAKIVVARQSPGAKPVLYRDFIYLQPYVPTKFAVGLVDDVSEESSYVTYALQLFNQCISPPITIFSPQGCSVVPAPRRHFRQDAAAAEQRAISPAPIAAIMDALPALPAPPRVEALPAPPAIFFTETLRGMISRKNSQEEDEETNSALVESVVDELVNEAITTVQEEEMRAPMLIIEETAEEVNVEGEENEEEVEQAEEVKAEESSEDDTQSASGSEFDSESISDVEELDVEDEDEEEEEGEEVDSDFEVIYNEEHAEADKLH